MKQYLESKYGEFNDWQFLFDTPQTWKLILIVAILISTIIISFYSIKSLNNYKKIAFLIIPKILLTAILIIIFCNPAITIRNVKRGKEKIVIMVDCSGSMLLPAKEGKSKFKQAKFYADIITKEFNSSNNISIETIGFATDIQKVSEPDYENKLTDIIGSIENTIISKHANPPQAIFLISDGADTTELYNIQQNVKNLPKLIIEKISKWDIPIYTIYTGGTNAIKDLSIDKIHHDQIAFTHKNAWLQIKIKNTNMSDVTIPVTVKENNNILSIKEVSIENGQTAKLEFEITFHKEGRKIVKVEIPSLKGDKFSSNNSKSIILRVVRDRIRILHICGNPSWDQHFLRLFMKSNPNIDLISFYILRTPTDLQLVPSSELSLIPFPVDELFRNKLNTFDLIILQNFDYRPFNMQVYLSYIKKFVLDGGGLVMIGGNKSFSNGGYQFSELKNILPIELKIDPLLHTDKYKMQLSQFGRLHPITDIFGDAVLNENYWNQLPEVEGCNLFNGLKDDSYILFKHPYLTAKNTNMPIIALGNFSKGRTAIIATDTLWLWNFQAKMDGQNDNLYNHFWERTIRWMLNDPEMKQIQLRTDKENVEPNEEFSILLNARDKMYRPASKARVHLSFKDVKSNKKLGLKQLTLDENGKFNIKYFFKNPGMKKLQADIYKNNQLIGKDSTHIFIDSGIDENLGGNGRPDILQAISKATDGQVLTETDIEQPHDISIPQPPITEVKDSRTIKLWDNLFVLLLISLFAGIEWWTRRKWGFD